MITDRRAGGAERRATLKDVAELAGVSWSTVSNVIHNRPYVRDEVRERVRAAIAEVGYKPSLVGRQLRRGRSDLLALAIPEIESPYFARLAHAVIQEAEHVGFTVLIDETDGDIARERAVAEGFWSRGIEGIIFSPAAMAIDEIVNLKGERPLVLLGEHVRPGPVDHIMIDNVLSARQAVEHLVLGGRRNIAFMGYQPHRSGGPGDVRLEGYEQGLAAAGLPFNPTHVLTARNYTREEGERIALEFLARIHECDAIICATDLLAIGAMRCFRSHGVKVPDDIALIGWDNTPDGAYSSPTLTTIDHDLEAISRTAVRLVLAQLDKTNGAPTDVVVPHSLIVRESTDPR